VSTQAQEPGKRAWSADKDERLGRVAYLADWVRWHRALTVVIILALAAVAAFAVKMSAGGQSGNAEACTAYYNAQNFAADSDTTDAGQQIQVMVGEAPRITSHALAQAVQVFQIGLQKGGLNPAPYSNQAVARACVKLGLGNSASN
jgi:hypothetical protein